MKTNFRYRRGFTLVELMVVMAIVIVLAALAFIFVRRGMEKARLAGSVSRVRDLGAMVMAYTADHRDELPVWHDYNKGKYWWQLISEETEIEGYEAKLFKSPNHRLFDPDNVAATISYGWNYPVIGRHKGDSSFAADHVLRLANFRDPGRVLVFADGARENSWGYLDAGNNIPDPGRYDGKAAAFILDGSVQVLNTPEDFGPESRWFVPVRELLRK